MKNGLGCIVSNIMIACLLFCLPSSLFAAACDVNGDGQEGIPEAIHALQVAVDNIPGTLVCPPGLSACSGRCVDTEHDPGFCGDCTTDCGSSSYCDDGSCKSLLGGTCWEASDCMSGRCTDGVCLNSKIVFVSSQRYTGQLGGLRGADAKCQGLANAADLSGNYRAWLADDIGSPDIHFTRSQAPYILTDGSLVALNWEDLTDGSLVGAIFLDEHGDPIPSSNGRVAVWTNTDPQGQSIGYADEGCGQWKSGDVNVESIVGLINNRDATWSTGDIRTCNDWLHLYCFEQ